MDSQTQSANTGNLLLLLVLVFVLTKIETNVSKVAVKKAEKGNHASKKQSTTLLYVWKLYSLNLMSTHICYSYSFWCISIHSYIDRTPI